MKGKHERQFAYEAHTACDKNGYVLETVVIPGSIHDSVAFDDVYDKVTKSFPQIETIVADSAYKTPHVWKKYEELADDARYTPQYKDLYARRKETIERVFAQGKAWYALYALPKSGPGFQMGEA